MADTTAGKVKTKTGKDRNSIWSPETESIGVTTLKQAKEDGKWGDNNPKSAAWTMCVEALSGSEKVTGGAPKDDKAIKRRWQRVCAYTVSWIVCALTVFSFFS